MGVAVGRHCNADACSQQEYSETGPATWKHRKSSLQPGMSLHYQQPSAFIDKRNPQTMGSFPTTIEERFQAPGRTQAEPPLIALRWQPPRYPSRQLIFLHDVDAPGPSR